jgi:hypothetical protein
MWILITLIWNKFHVFNGYRNTPCSTTRVTWKAVEKCRFYLHYIIAKLTTSLPTSKLPAFKAVPFWRTHWLPRHIFFFRPVTLISPDLKFAIFSSRRQTEFKMTILYCVCFVMCGCVCMCGCFGNMCTCIYCVLYCVYCVFVLFLLCIFILNCCFCITVRTTATEWQLKFS